MQGSIDADPVAIVSGGDASVGTLRVALDATPLLGHQTGVGVFCREAIAALNGRADLAVQAFAVSWRRRGGIEAHLPQGVEVAQRPMPARPLHAAWGRVDWPPLEWFIGAVDVVHGTNFVVPPTKRAASVVSVHDLTPLHHPELCNAATLAFPALIERAVRRGAWVHTDSAFVAAEVAEAFSVGPERVRVVHLGIPPLPAAAPNAVAQLETQWPVMIGRRVVVAVGTAEPRKDLPGLVGAFDVLAASRDDIALVLAGPPGWGEDALTAAIDGATAAPRIIRTGWVDDATLAALLARADVLAFPSRYEGFGFPPLQAMAAGVPVVTTRAGSLPEVVGAGAMLVDVGDHQQLVGALAEVLDDDGVRERLVAAGHDQAAQYSWSQCADGLAALYRDAAADHG